jgi:hypothetical protein
MSGGVRSITRLINELWIVWAHSAVSFPVVHVVEWRKRIRRSGEELIAQ